MGRIPTKGIPAGSTIRRGASACITANVRKQSGRIKMLEEVTFVGKELQLIDILCTATIDPHNFLVVAQRKGVGLTSTSTVLRTDIVLVHDLNGVNVLGTPHPNFSHCSASRIEVVEWATTGPSLNGTGPCMNGWTYIYDIVNEIQDPECKVGCTFGQDSSGICWVQRHAEDDLMRLVKTTIDTYTSMDQFNLRSYRQSGSMLFHMSIALHPRFLRHH